MMAIPKQQLNIHKPSKHDETKVSCEQFDYKTAYRSSIDVPGKKSKHVGIIYDCDQCCCEAAGKEILKRHKQSKPEGI